MSLTQWKEENQQQQSQLSIYYDNYDNNYYSEICDCYCCVNYFPDVEEQIQKRKNNSSTIRLIVDNSFPTSPISWNNNFVNEILIEFEDLRGNEESQSSNDQFVQPPLVSQQTQGSPLVIERSRIIRGYKNYPEETKNFPKNMGHRLQQFIINSFHDIEQVRDDRIIQKFLERPPKSIIKVNLNELKQSFYGAQILRFFFADYVWAADCIVKNKMELTQTLIINQMWCDEL